MSIKYQDVSIKYQDVILHALPFLAKIGLNTYNRNEVGHNCRSFTYCGITTDMQGRTIDYKRDRMETPERSKSEEMEG
jgi:hypothetical protein